jgi:phospholipase A1
MSAAPVAPAVTEPPARELAKKPEGKPQKLEYRFILTGYKDDYFLAGFSRSSEVKFQLSFKLDLWPNQTNHSVYFGYTQKSLWNLYDSSSPFVDSNYNPELFYGYFKRYGDVVWRPGRITGFIDSARIGVEHESNGRDGLESRAWNRIYGDIDAGAYLGTDHYLTGELKAWAPPFFVDDNNTDITDYLGYGKVTAIYGYDPAYPRWWGGGHVGVTYFHGWTRDAKQGLEAFFQWRPAYDDRYSWWRFTPNFFAQLYTGYGEYLLRYNESHTSIRIGISIDDRVHWLDRKR